MMNPNSIQPSFNFIQLPSRCRSSPTEDHFALAHQTTYESLESPSHISRLAAHTNTDHLPRNAVEYHPQEVYEPRALAVLDAVDWSTVSHNLLVLKIIPTFQALQSLKREVLSRCSVKERVARQQPLGEATYEACFYNGILTWTANQVVSTDNGLK